MGEPYGFWASSGPDGYPGDIISAANEAEELRAENERLREALRDLADAYRGIALDHPTVVTRHLPLIRAEEVLFGSDDRG